MGRSARKSGRTTRVADLAAELGLSTATVSRALNGSDAVRPEVARRVLDHARRRGYTPNWLARSLAAQSQTFVGFLVPDINNTAYSIAAGACARLLGAHGYQLILAITGDDPEQEYEALNGIAGTQAASVIVAPSAGITEQASRALATMPVIEFNRTAGLGPRGVFCADRAAFQEATQHLLELGHTDIGYVGTTDAISNGRERLAGVRDALAAAGLELAPERVRLLSPTEARGWAAARELLDRTDRPSALLAGSSSLSVGAAQVVRELDLTVPDELSLIVYGDPEWSGLCDPGLTTIAVPYREMAEVVADLIVGLVNGSPRGCAVDEQHWLPARLVSRGSTAAPSRSTSTRRK